MIKITKTINKYYCLQNLASEEKITVPDSVMIRNPKQLKEALKAIGGTPAIMKILAANYKLGAMLIENEISASSFLDVNVAMGGIGQIGQGILIEKYYKESDGKAINLLMLEDKVISSYYSIKSFDFKQATKLFNKEEKGQIVPQENIKHLASLATKKLGTSFSQVSIIETHEGPKIFEIDIMPEIDTFSKFSNTPIAKEIINFAILKHKEKLNIYE